MTHRRKGSSRSPAIRVTQHDDLMTAGRQLCRVHGSIICFRAAVREERFLQTARRDLRELLSQIRLRFIAVESRSVRNRTNLIDDRFIHARVSMTYANRKHAAEAIEILIALIIPDVKSFALHQRQRLLVVSGDRREKKFFVFADGFGRCGLWFSSTHSRSFMAEIPRSLQIFYQQVSDLVMSWDRGSLVQCRIVPPGMLRAFAQELATFGTKIANQLLSLHTA